MTKAEYLEFFQQQTSRMFEITKAKNADYAGDKDPFANFTMVEQLGIATTEQGFLTRMTDKLSRLVNLLQPGRSAQVKDESIEDTLLDLANYSILLAAYLKRNQVEEFTEEYKQDLKEYADKLDEITYQPATNSGEIKENSNVVYNRP